MAEFQIFESQTEDANSDAIFWNYKTGNVIIEGTWDSATITMQIRRPNGTWISFLEFTEDDFVIIDNLLPCFEIRFALSDVGASTSLNTFIIMA